MNVGDLVTFTISDLLVFRKRSAEECMIDILTKDSQRFWCFTQFAKTVNCIGI
jgi:hypothetical protein